MELLQYTFFQHALIGSLLASIACGLIGTYIVTRRLVFISGGLTHASFGGIGLGLYTGISPILSAALFAVLSAFGVEWLSKRKDMREDSAIAVFWTLGMALGIMFTFLSPGFAPDLSAYLFGNILTITWSDIALLGGLALLLILFFALYLHPIIYVAFDREFARSQGIPVQVFEYVLMMFRQNAIWGAPYLESLDEDVRTMFTEEELDGIRYLRSIAPENYIHTPLGRLTHDINEEIKLLKQDAKKKYE